MYAGKVTGTTRVSYLSACDTAHIVNTVADYFANKQPTIGVLETTRMSITVEYGRNARSSWAAAVNSRSKCTKRDKSISRVVSIGFRAWS